MTPAQSQAGRSHPLANTTPFPNGLFELMPSLKDSEWRVLCLIVRQTWGWKEGDGRKHSDWITQKQMMRRTGRSSEALSRAVDALVRRGLIEVRDEDGELLATPNERRRCGGRLYFSVKVVADNSNRKTTARKSEVLVPKNQATSRKSGVRKANTTKETETKYLQKQNGESRKSENPATLRVEDSRVAQGVSQAEISRFLGVYSQLMRERGSADAPQQSKDQARSVHDLLQRHGFDRLVDLLVRFLRGCEGNPNCSLGAFQSEMKGLLIADTKERLFQVRVSTGWSRADTAVATGETRLNRL